jgi:hypothetical protein
MYAGTGAFFFAGRNVDSPVKPANDGRGFADQVGE